jgi:hypothetical protein
VQLSCCVKFNLDLALKGLFGSNHCKSDFIIVNLSEMKKIFLILVLFVTIFGYNQEVLNLRYDLDYVINAFENIIVKDSCYYTTSFSTNLGSSYKKDATLTCIKFDGSIKTTTSYVNDTLGIQFISTHSDLINTLDNKFAVLAKTTNSSWDTNLMFYKLELNGDTLFTNYINDIILDGNSILNVNTLIQNNDSTYNCIIHLSKDSNLLGGIALLKLSKTGELVWHKYFWGLGVNYYRILRANSLLKYDENRLLIGATSIEAQNTAENWKKHTKLIMTDTLGNLLWQRTYWEDTINPQVNGLTKTIDGGVLYGGLYGRYSDIHNGIEYKSQITKLDANFDLEWRIKFNEYGGSNYTFNNILAVNDSQFVAVGNNFTVDTDDIPDNKAGYLVKFNSQGQILWERKYTKVPHFDGENNWATHILLDVAITPDSGFVMVGESTNFYTDNGVSPGQQGWLVKVDKHGCLVPNCQQYDNVDTTTTDTTVVQPPVVIPENVLYPNPANTSLYYYHTQTDTTQQQTAYMYNLQGELVQQFSLMDSNITYSIDVSNFASGVYIFSIKNKNGDFIRREKVIVQH